MEKSNSRSNEPVLAPAASRGKKAYARPVLKKYGNVTHLTRGGIPSTSSDSGANMMSIFTPSDRALKQGILRIGTHPLGIGLYLFEYKPAFRDACGHGLQFGVMADEVEALLPEAVCLHPEGYRMVDYARLGVRSSASSRH